MSELSGEKLNALSAHADQGEILRWLRGFKAPPKRTFIVHGEPPAQEALRDALRRLTDGAGGTEPPSRAEGASHGGAELVHGEGLRDELGRAEALEVFRAAEAASLWYSTFTLWNNTWPSGVGWHVDVLSDCSGWTSNAGSSLAGATTYYYVGAAWTGSWPQGVSCSATYLSVACCSPGGAIGGG